MPIGRVPAGGKTRPFPWRRCRSDCVDSVPWKSCRRQKMPDRRNATASRGQRARSVLSAPSASISARIATGCASRQTGAYGPACSATRKLTRKVRCVRGAGRRRARKIVQPSHPPETGPPPPGPGHCLTLCPQHGHHRRLTPAKKLENPPWYEYINYHLVTAIFMLRLNGIFDV